MKPDERELREGDIVQLHPDLQSMRTGGRFAGCLMIVSGQTENGVDGYFLVPQGKGQWPSPVFYSANWDELFYVGRAPWTLKAS